MLSEVKANCEMFLWRMYCVLRRTRAMPDAIHLYYRTRADNDKQLQQEVDFAIACGTEYATNIARELGRRIEPIPDLSSLSVLELGPGINFGAILICALFGARVAVFDKYLVDWNEAYHPPFYRLLRERLHDKGMGIADLTILDRIISEGCHSTEMIQAKRGDFDLGHIDLSDSSFDAVVSNAALEHVANVPRLCGELLRITRPGGIGIHQVDFRDHANNDRPLDFLATPDWKYSIIFSDGHGGGGNRVRPAELIAELRKVGFGLIRFQTNCFADEAYVQEIRPTLLSRYASMSVEDLCVVGGRIFILKKNDDNRPKVQWPNANPLERKVNEAVEFAIQSAKYFLAWLPQESAYLRNKIVLEAGPGQDFGIPLILMGFGARILLIDRYLCQWDPDFHPAYYRRLRQEITERFPTIDTDPLDQVIKGNTHAIPNLTTMRVGLENIHEVADSSIDITYSNATFEHLADPAKAIQQLARVTCPGGLGFHQIDFRDHRDFEHPLEYLTTAEEDSEQLLKKMAWSFGNGVRSTEFEDMFKAAGFQIIRFEANLLADEQYLTELRPRLRKKYQSMPSEALRVLGGRFFTIKPFSDDPWLHAILSGYADRGYPAELITSWALPSRDARTLIDLIEQQSPENVLEIGTFVGVSTLMMAAKLPKGAMIHTVDPNFPLMIELGAMNTPARGADLSVCHQELAAAVAQQLGLSPKITFHAGGFSTPATFASTKHDTSRTVPVIGPEVCQEHGPFDFIFIDGLHYTDAVLSDLRLACRYLQPGGRIVVHDVIGMWGSNVRRAVFQFISEQPDFSFQHGRYADIFDAIGVLQHLPQHEHRGPAENGPATGTSLLDRPEFISNLAAIAVNVCSPRRVVCIGRDRGGLLPQFARFGVEDLCHVGQPSESLIASQIDPLRIKSEIFDFQDVYQPAIRFDLCVCIYDDAELDDSQLQHVIDSCVACSDTILFGSTPPGESGFATSRSRPLAWWVRQFWKRGYRFHDVIRPSLEPLRFAYSYSPIYEVTSSELANLYLIRREPLKDSNADPQLEELLVEKDSRMEDMTLQAVFSDILLQDLLKKWKEAQDLVARQNARLQKMESTVGENEQMIEERDGHIKQMEKSLRQCEQMLEVRDARLQEIEQSLEYRAARRLGAYPNLLRVLARLYGFLRRH